MAREENMTREEAIEAIEVIEKRYVTLDNEERQALNVAISTMKSYETLSQRLGHLPFRIYEGKEMVDRLDIYNTVNGVINERSEDR